MEEIVLSGDTLIPEMGVPLCIILHHGGKWETKQGLKYVGGTVKLLNDIPSNLDVPYLKSVISLLGYTDVIKLHYCDPLKSLQNGIRFLGYEDVTFTKFKSLLDEYRMIDVFIEHDDCDDEAINSTITEQSIPKNIVNSFVSVNCENNNQEIEKDVDYDELGSDNEDDEVREARFLIQDEKKAENEYLNEEDSLVRLAERKGKILEDNDGDYEDDSSDFESPPNSEDEDDYGYLLLKDSKKKKVKMASNQLFFGKNEQQCPFYLGQEFENASEFKKAVTNYSVRIGRDLQYSRNDAKRVGVKCKVEKCSFYIWTSLESCKKTFIVKTLKPQHNCGRVAHIRKLRASWIAETYHAKFKVNPYLKCQEIVDTIWSEWGVKASLWLALKARRAAQTLILGEYKEQYGLLYRYSNEIMKSNPNNTIKFKLDNGIFERVYICFDAIKKGFLAGCRPFFGIDGCFLKGPFGGQLLVAIGRDGNNQMFPIAWACVEVENTETWGWFLQLLADDLGTSDGFGYTIMSDQQKGLLKAVSLVWPRADSRCCARHVYCNFRQVFGGGLEYRRGFWKIAKSSTENDFKANMDLFASINLDAAKDLLKRNYKKWVRAYFSTTSTCESVDNNMNEVFNAYILSSRHKPIITMLEDIREGLMERLHKKRDFILNKEIIICPRIQARLEKSKLYARGWVAFWDGHFSYGVREGATQRRYVVSLLDRTCSCNVWQLSGIPCNHAVAAIWKAQEHPEHYVSSYYTKATYLKAYEFPLEPLNGPEQWPQSSKTPIQAPQLKKLQHRPTSKRKPSLGEVEAIKLTKKGHTQVHKCSNCKQQGHNKKKCPLPPQTTPMHKVPPSINPTKKSGKLLNDSISNSDFAPLTQQSQNFVPIHNGPTTMLSSTGYQRQAWNATATQSTNTNFPNQSSVGSNIFHSNQHTTMYNGPTQMF